MTDEELAMTPETFIEHWIAVSWQREASGQLRELIQKAVDAERESVISYLHKYSERLHQNATKDLTKIHNGDFIRGHILATAADCIRRGKHL